MIEYKQGVLYMDPVTYAKLFILNYVEGYIPETRRAELENGNMGTLGQVPVIQTLSLKP